MVRIRMQRLGRRHRPFYRISAIDQRTRRNGRVIEALGWFDPLAKDESKQIELKGERIQYWLSQGAQPTETVEDLLARHDLLPDKMKAAWEARRAEANARVAAKVSLKKAEAAVAAIGELAGSAEANLSEFQSQAAAAFKATQDAVAKADVKAATKAAADAESAVESAKAAEAKAQAAKKKAEEEAAAAAAASESSEGEKAEGE
ncbi:MAG: 30S ribosomal protein S16 [Phycisphaerales bacterium]